MQSHQYVAVLAWTITNLQSVDTLPSADISHLLSELRPAVIVEQSSMSSVKSVLDQNQSHSQLERLRGEVV